MIIGNGDIAKALRPVDRADIVFFASGVSSSKETRLKEFDREIDMLHNIKPDRHIVYFSTLSVYYSYSPYVKHKEYIENLIQVLFASYTIVRLGNITWGNNPNTLLNFFRNEYRAGREPVIQDCHRYLINKEEFLHWMKMIRVGQKDIMNITGQKKHVREIADMCRIQSVNS